VIAWRTDARGVIYVTSAPGETERAPVLAGPMAELFDGRVMRWESMAATICSVYGVALAHMLAMIFRESGGNPDARNAERPPGLGLCQITNLSLYCGHTPGEVMIPRINIALAAKYLRYLAEHCPGAGLPELASLYNAGAALGPGATIKPHPSALSPWGYRETPGHIAAEVAASNYYLGLTAPIEGVIDPLDGDNLLGAVALSCRDEIRELLERHVRSDGEPG